MIDLRGLSRSFSTPDGVVRAVHEISLNVQEGAFFSIVGPSGCGKSTTLRMLAGLERPSAGEIAIDGRTVYSSETGLFVPANKRRVGMVFQSYAIWPHMTVARNVAYPLRIARRPRDEVRRRVMEALRLVGLEELADRPAPRLSGGQQQRVALARAIVAEPAVLLLDEPLSNLDAALRQQMRVELKRLQERVGLTTVYVTHDQQEALAMSDQIAVMESGVIRQVGQPSDIYHRPVNRFVAEFIGKANLIQGETMGGPSRVGSNELATPLGPMVAEADEASGRREVLVCIRPELAELSVREPAGSAGANVYRGVVERTIFLGESVDCTVNIGGVSVDVKAPADGPVLSPGTDVWLTISPRHCRIVRQKRVDRGADGTRNRSTGVVAGA